MFKFFVKHSIISNFLVPVLIFLICPDYSKTDEVYRSCETSSDLGKKQGICISLTKDKLKQCGPLKKYLQNKNWPALHESFCEGPKTPNDIPWVKVCCPKDEYVDEPEPKFENHPNYNLLPHSNCGVTGVGALSDRIVGGEDVKPGELPWMTRIALKRFDEDHVEIVCGGSVISSRYILTAAHCFKDRSTKLAYVILGETDEETDPECIALGDNNKVCANAEEYEHEDLIIHPEYNGNTGSQHDLALIRLSKVVNFTSPFIRPICLPFDRLPPIHVTAQENLKFLVAGWGIRKNSDNEGSVKLQQLTVPMQDNMDCNKIFRDNNITISESQLCAGGQKSKGSCAGDSGSPLSYLTKSLKGEFNKLRQYQIGIVSFGKARCAVENTPVVYTRVRKYLNWILDHIKP